MKKIACILLCLLIIPSFWGCSNLSGEQISVSDVTGWVLTDETCTNVSDGISYIERHYTDDEQLPYRVYLLLLDLQKVTLHTGTSNNDFRIIPADRQDVLQQMQASEQDGLDVLAAVNGDFFAIDTSFQPTGLCIKSGTIISANIRYRPYAAITKAGDFVISNGVADQTDPSSLEMAVGGSHVILADGKIAEFDSNDDLANTAHPRTLSGIKPDGTVILAVIDGRQRSLSNGANLTQCAELMRSLGATTAINHDGGGSSTMILHSAETYQVMNSPSDGNLRKVFCSIQVIKKQ